jgi:hypothetical protein
MLAAYTALAFRSGRAIVVKGTFDIVVAEAASFGDISLGLLSISAVIFISLLADIERMLVVANITVKCAKFGKSGDFRFVRRLSFQTF